MHSFAGRDIQNLVKKTYIEVLRIIAILFVIYNHTRTIGFELFTVTAETSSYWISYIMYPLCKIAVPLFLMISGVNLLDKKETVKELFLKRVIKHIFIIVLFGTLQYLRYVRVGKAAFSVLTWFSSWYSSPMLETYWFLYMYLGFLLILPLMRKMVILMEKKDYAYLFIIFVVSNVFKIIGYFSGNFINAYIFVLTDVLFYPLLGYGLSKYCNQMKKRYVLTTIIATEILFIVLGLVYKNIHPDDYNGLITLIQMGTPILTSGVFVFIKHLFIEKESKWICEIGKTVFGIYLIEDIARNQFEKIITKFDLANKMNDFLVAVLFVAVTFVSSSMLVYFVLTIKNG